MSEVPCSLTELKIQIGKDIHRQAMMMTAEIRGRCMSLVDDAPDNHRVDVANYWRAKCPQVAKEFGSAAEKALLELPDAGGHTVSTLLRGMIDCVLNMAAANQDEEAFYGFATLNGTLSTNASNAKQYFEALVAYGRGE